MAAIEALHGNQQPLQEMKTAFHRRRDLMYKLIRELPGITCLEPQGAFYCFPNISEWLGRTIRGIKINNSKDFCIVCLKEALVALVPGSAFGDDKFVRLSFATDDKNISEALRRLKDLLTNP
jgi:aspartate aminotransferase